MLYTFRDGSLAELTPELTLQQPSGQQGVGRPVVVIHRLPDERQVVFILTVVVLSMVPQNLGLCLEYFVVETSLVLLLRHYAVHKHV